MTNAVPRFYHLVISSAIVTGHKIAAFLDEVTCPYERGGRLIYPLFCASKFRAQQGLHFIGHSLRSSSTLSYPSTPRGIRIFNRAEPRPSPWAANVSLILFDRQAIYVAKRRRPSLYFLCYNWRRDIRPLDPQDLCHLTQAIDTGTFLVVHLLILRPLLLRPAHRVTGRAKN